MMEVILKRFENSAAPHDSRAVGDEPYVSRHFLGAEKYTRVD
jgi:hypothetical protein